jgi:iron(III) transport system ATP-binding protein
MTVADNVAFPLKVRRAPRKEIRSRVAEALELVELGGLQGRYPHELSGGQRQRVALARALVYQPSVLLLDEPFSNLDAKLRERARSWLKQLQQRLGLTTVFVTHDQDEAMSMSDRIVVMDEGHIQQIGTPEEVYREPANRFVATFLGRCNVLDGVVRTRGADGSAEVELADGGPTLLIGRGLETRPEQPVSVVLRPESIRLVDRASSNGDHGGVPEPNRFDVSVTDVSFLGDHYEYQLSVGGLALVAQSPHQVSVTDLKVVVDPASCRLL